MEEDNEWQITCIDLKQRGTKLFEYGQWSDVTILVGPEQVPFQAHKLILSMASPVFESMFFAEETENDSISISDVKPEAFKAMLNYTYTENITIDSYEMAQAVYTCAHKYVLLQLAQVCVTYMSCNLTVENACLAFQTGLMYGETGLVDESLPIIRYQICDVLRCSSFEKLDVRTIEKIFSLEGLQVDNELELFSAMERHMMSRLRTSLVDASQYRPALSHIRLLTLSAQQFAVAAARSPLLTQQDAFALLARIAGGDAVRVRLPPGLSDSRERRCKAQAPPPVVKLPAPPSNSAAFRLVVPLSGGRPQSVASAPQAAAGTWFLVRALPRLETATSGTCETFLAVYIRCEQPAPAPWSCRAGVEFQLLSHRSSGAHRTQRLEFSFTFAQPECGCPRLGSAPDMGPEGGFVRDDALAVLVVLTARAGAPSPGI